MTEGPFPLPPGSMIGIVGGGQLGRMLALAAARLGFDTVVLTPDAKHCAARVATRTLVAPYDDADALSVLAQIADVVTFEFENVPAAVIERLDALGVVTAPNGRALAIAQDRVDEKSFLNACGAATVPFTAVQSADDVASALSNLGVPALLKTRREGYDGKGQTWVEGQADAAAAFKRIGARPAILEAACTFVREVSVIAARGRKGEIACYPLAENHHENGVLRRTSAPARSSAKVTAQAEMIAARILGKLDYIGVIGVEMFELADGKLLVNEIAPRVHNTGHWTLDGCEVDPFEQHIRAIAGWPLGTTRALAHVEMENLLGDEINQWRRIAADPEARLWHYGKGEPRPGRKMGHVNRLRQLL
ncbi:MAG: phosphoribosylaminoimidazole carboxylase, ATPase subunit [Caulobacteraceae bacterium]|nr:phosphoribosylaminoimidazole carboxylase, ATPase subunit [Caulobacteraceae bacterium]